MALNVNGVEVPTRSTVIFNGKEVKRIINNGVEVWRKAEPLIPAMTSNTTPSGIASCSSKYDDMTEAYMAFDGKLVSNWLNKKGVDSTGILSQYISYEFSNPVYIDHLSFVGIGTHADYQNLFDSTIDVSLDNGTSGWVEVWDFPWSATDAYNEIVIPLKVSGIKKITLRFGGRMRDGADIASNHYVSCAELQAYGHIEE